MRVSAWVLLGAALLADGTLDAQSVDTLLKRDARVKMWSSGLGYSASVGFLDSRTADSLGVRIQFQAAEGRLESNVVRLSRSQLDRLQVEVRTGMTARKGARQGVAWGGFIGGVVGFVGAVLSLPPPGSAACRADYWGICRTLSASMLLGAVGGVAGGGLGMAVGLPVGLVTGYARSTRWVEVPTIRSK